MNRLRADLGRRSGPIVRSLLVWAVLGAIVWLDRGPHPEVHTAAVFSAIVTAIVWLGNILGAVGGAIAVSLESVVVWLVQGLGWVTRRVADVLLSTGAMFARVWDGVKVFYFDVLRPALVWLHDTYLRIQSWLTRVVKPVFTFLRRVRDELLSIYKRFVRPVLDIIDTVRGGLRVLSALGIEWAKALDQKLAEVESTITENFLWMLAQVNSIIDILGSVVTFDRLLQRSPLIRSLNRDAGLWLRTAWNAQENPLTPEERLRLVKTAADKTVADHTHDFTTYATTRGGELAPRVSELAAQFDIDLRAAA